jgi:hypothetical protein
MKRGESTKGSTKERNAMVRRILAVVAIVLGVLAIFTSHAFGVSALHLVALGVVTLGVALVIAA